MENVMAQFTRPADKASVTRAKHRVMLDENLRLEMPDGSVTSFAELFLERDIQKLTRVYNRQMSGRIGAARMRVGKELDGENHLLIDGITHDGEFDTLIQKVRAVAAEVGQDRAELESDVRLLTYLYKGLVGTPIMTRTRPWRPREGSFGSSASRVSWGRWALPRLPSWGTSWPPRA